jgi:hypothetical protein
VEQQRQVWHRGVGHAFVDDLFEELVAEEGEFLLTHADKRSDVELHETPLQPA